ncbi:MAG: hypothetical protein ACRDE8_02555 [Ginsengibacter sp.]
MSLDNIHLPGFLYVSMFKNYLVDLKPNKDNKTAAPQVTVGFLGGNSQNILLVTKDIQNKFLADDQMKFLNDLLNACNLTMADIAVVNIYEKNGLTYQDLKKELIPKKILLFGVAAKELDLPFEIPFFQVQNFHEQLYIICPSLEEIQLNKDLKKQLWNSLQKIFNIQKQK